MTWKWCMMTAGNGRKFTGKLLSGFTIILKHTIQWCWYHDSTIKLYYLTFKTAAASHTHCYKPASHMLIMHIKTQETFLLIWWHSKAYMPNSEICGWVRNWQSRLPLCFYRPHKCPFGADNIIAERTRPPHKHTQNAAGEKQLCDRVESLGSSLKKHNGSQRNFIKNHSITFL